MFFKKEKCQKWPREVIHMTYLTQQSSEPLLKFFSQISLGRFQRISIYNFFYNQLCYFFYDFHFFSFRIYYHVTKMRTAHVFMLLKNRSKRKSTENRLRTLLQDNFPLGKGTNRPQVLEFQIKHQHLRPMYIGLIRILNGHSHLGLKLNSTSLHRASQPKGYFPFSYAQCHAFDYIKLKDSF